MVDTEKKKQCLVVFLSLSGKASVVASQLNTEDLKKETEIDTLLAKLNGVFLVDKGRRQFTAFSALLSLKRLAEVKVRDFIVELEHK